MIDDDDDLLDDDDELPDDEAAGDAAGPAWVMLVVDDEPDVLAVTRVALAGLSYQGRGLEIIGAASAAEARGILARRRDIAVILLDVVMETDHAGLDLAREIRQTMELADVRIVLRTGQPGRAPEREVILAFDINDYKSKTELTADRLFSTVVTALRGYADMRELDRMRSEAYAQLGGQVALLALALSLVPEPMLHVDRDGVITVANEPFTGLVGGDVVGEAIADVLPGFDAEAETQAVGSGTYAVEAAGDDDGGYVVLFGTVGAGA
jgi:CheY-like chemotaxis protein